MGKISLLDCTLRDGGYINDWRFGTDAVKDITEKLTEAGMDFVEVGFLRDEGDFPGRTVFPSVDQINQFTGGAMRGNVTYCAMCEALNPLPIELVEQNNRKNVDVIRVIVWKRILDKGFEYCRGIVEKGYRLCVQPNRIDQYSHEEFAEMIRRFNELSPLAVYVVDSFGLLNSREIMEYVKIADNELERDIALGYHGHNNMQQAFGVAQDILGLNIDRDIMIDGSVFGIGRGAGNLATELIANYMNEQYDRNYDIGKLLEINDLYIQDIYNKEKWGYLPCYYLTARHRCNPMYGLFYEGEHHLKAADINKILAGIENEDKIIFTRDKGISYAAKQGIIL